MSRVTFSEARARIGGIKGLLVKLGDGPNHEHKWKAFPKCPFCDGKGCAGVFAKGGVELFKCHHTGCTSGGAVLSEVSYIAAREGLSDQKPAGGGASPAYQRFLELAGCWEAPQERRTAAAQTTGPHNLPAEGTANQPAGTVADRDGNSSRHATNGGSEPVARFINTPPVFPVPAIDGSSTSATASFDHLPAMPVPPRRHGDEPCGPGDGTSAPVARALGEPEELRTENGEVRTAEPEEAGAEIEMPAGPFAKEVPQKMGTERSDPVQRAAETGTDGAETQAPKEIAAEGNGEQGTSNGELQAPKAEQGTADAGAKVKNGKTKPAAADESLAALKAFLRALTWLPEHQLELFKKRALTPGTARVAGLRSNVPANAGLIRGLTSKFSTEALVLAGLLERVREEDWETTNGERGTSNREKEELIDGCRPAPGFCGFGQVALLKLRNFPGQSPQQVKAWARGEFRQFEPLRFREVRDSDGRVKEMAVNGLNFAPIIPYFQHLPDEEQDIYDLILVTEGEFKVLAFWQTFAEDIEHMPSPDPERLIALRTHKLWAWRATPHAYVTPNGRGTVKLGGRTFRAGAAALPGIAFARLRGGTWGVAHELREMFRLTRAEVGAVYYDNEDKGDRALAGFQPEVKKRFDAVAWGLFLARDLHKSGVNGRFGMIPDEWRDAKGKADFDGALAAMVHGTPNGERGTASAEPPKKRAKPVPAARGANDEPTPEELAATFPEFQGQE